MAKTSVPKEDRKISGTTTNRRVFLVRFPEKKLKSPPKAERPAAAFVASALNGCFMTPAPSTGSICRPEGFQLGLSQDVLIQISLLRSQAFVEVISGCLFISCQEPLHSCVIPCLTMLSSILSHIG